MDGRMRACKRGVGRVANLLARTGRPSVAGGSVRTWAGMVSILAVSPGIRGLWIADVIFCGFGMVGRRTIGELTTPMQVFVKHVSTSTLLVEPTDTVEEVRAKVHAKLAWLKPTIAAHDLVRLRYGGRELTHASATLADYNIHEHATLHVTVGTLKGGCAKSSIVPSMMIMALLFLITGAVLASMGFVVMGHEYGSIAFNNENVGLGFLCFFIGGGMAPLAFVGMYAARAHNKFCLTVYVAATVIIIFFQWGIGSGLVGIGKLPDAIPEGIQQDCNRLVSDGSSTPAICKQYYEDPKIKRIFDLWKHMHDQSLTTPSVKSFLLKLQKGKVKGFPCCGFGKPSDCNEDRALCGFPKGDYAATTTCTIEDAEYVKESPDDPGKFGCPFEYPVGVCALTKLNEFSAGCAYTTHTWVWSEISGIGTVITVLSIIPAIGACFACCMCFKRKHEDVLPTKYVQTMGS